MSANATLVLGGTRSGKSEYGEGLVIDAGKPPVYIATGQGGDREMNERIKLHQQRRGSNWQTIEEPLDVCGVLENIAADKVVLLDCITLWVANLMAAKRNVAAEIDNFCTIVDTAKLSIVIVSNEVGLGIVPDNKLARQFRDEAGKANQMIAKACDRVVFVAAGIPLILKG